jgi:hypothetical protein
MSIHGVEEIESLVPAAMVREASEERGPGDDVLAGNAAEQGESLGEGSEGSVNAEEVVEQEELGVEGSPDGEVVEDLAGEEGLRSRSREGMAMAERGQGVHELPRLRVPADSSIAAAAASMAAASAHSPSSSLGLENPISKTN